MAGGGGGGNLVFFVTGPNFSTLPFTLLHNSSIIMEDLGSSSSDGGVSSLSSLLTSIAFRFRLPERKDETEVRGVADK